MEFTVIIPTFNREGLLRIALQSIRLQTAKHLISKVVVSENGLTRASEAVCEEFADLPIQYVYQQKQLTVQKHMQWLMSQEYNTYVALLCDDDWWDIHHLAMAHESLTRYKDCIAYFSNFTYVESTHSLKGQSYYNGVEVLHLNNTTFCNYQPTVYTKENIFLFSFLLTPFHFSAMICRSDVLAKSAAIFDYMHPTYADRLLYPVISTFGNVIFNPLKTAMILYHSSMDSHNYNANEWNSERQNGSLKLLEIAEESGIDLRDILNNTFATYGDDDRKFIIKELMGTFPNRKNINWFNGIEKILENDNTQLLSAKKYNSFKQRVIRKTINTIRKVL